MGQHRDFWSDFMNITTRSALRTPAGLLVPIMMGTSAAVLNILVICHWHDSTWMGLDKAGRLLVAGLAIFAAVASEWLVLRQRKLIADGQLVEAIVDDVQPLSWSNFHSVAYYHFFTQDRRVVASYCAIENRMIDRWSPGQTITAIHDPALPARHVVQHQLWAIQWQVNAPAEARVSESIELSCLPLAA
jgi:hypothetical protein